MPQCICGRFFKPLSYNVNGHKDEDLCQHCKSDSTPQNYINSVEWVGGDVSGMIIEDYEKDYG